MKRLLTIFSLILGILSSSALGAFVIFSERCEAVQNEVLRLHIPANSDSPFDQSLKLRLRDHILAEFGSRLETADTLTDAEIITAELLPEIEQSANQFLRDYGADYSARAELVTMEFPTREYEQYILPAGEYRALRITLGEGKGHNWWCVIFPQMCIPAVSEIKNAEAVEDFSQPQQIKVKFAIYEAIRELVNS